MEYVIIAWLALVLDSLIGDPNTRFHPVVLMGKAISLGEKLLYRQKAQEVEATYRGFILVLLLLLLTYGVGYGIVWGIHRLPEQYFILGYFLQALVFCFMISPKSLAKAGLNIYDPLEEGNIDEARTKVNYIVSRDAQRMNETDITRATVETIAENTMDGVVSPIFWFFVGGLPLLMVYRMVNTLDAMIGYKNDRYLYFGRTAAKVDDIFNLIPARITGLMFVLVAKMLGGSRKNSWQIMKRDAAKHPSPNGGYPEASLAGALGIQLGGLNYYFGRESFRAHMGDPVNPLDKKHILAAIGYMYWGSIAALFLMSIVTILIRS